MLTKVELPQGYKRLINKEKEKKDVLQIIDEEGYLREVSFDDLTSHPTTLAGYGITDAYISNGTIYLGNQSITPAAVSSLGTAAYKNYATSVTQGSTDLPTSDAVFQAIGAAVSSALHYRGISSTIITDGGTETAVIGGQPLVVQSGDVVIYSGFEFLWENNVWNKLGDDTSFALKTVQITGDGIYITGGGDLTTSRSLGLSQAAIDALTLASTALQSVAFSDLTSHPTTISGYGITDANISNGTITLGNNTITPLTSFTETDPIFSASPSAGITSADIDNWNAKQAAISDLSTIRTRSNEGHTAYGWGNHADVGYLTSFTETDPIFSASPAYGITTTNITNWNTAFSWGNHASEGYLKSVSFADLTSHPTTLSGYGITDAKIQNGVITLGDNTITPLTSFTETDPTVPSWAKQSTKPSYGLNEITGTDDLRAIEALSGTGLAKRTADNTWELTDTADKAEELVTSTEEDAMFTSRQVPSVAVGDVCKITSVKGKSVVWNQLVENGNFANGTSNWAANSCTMSVQSNVLNVTTTAENGGPSCNAAILSGHNLFIRFTVYASASANILVYLQGGSAGIVPITSGWQTVSILTTPSSAHNNMWIRFSVVGTYQLRNVNIIDLTQMFGAGNEPATVEEFEALYPLGYYDYNTGELVNNAASGVEMLDSGGNSLGEIATPITEIVPADKPTVRLNQLVPQGFIVVASSNGITAVNNRDGSYTLNGTATGLASLGGGSLSLVKDHYYYIRGGHIGVGVAFNIYNSSAFGSSGQSAPVIVKSNATTISTTNRIIVTQGTTLNNYRIYPQLIDLTEMYGAGNEPTSTAEVEELIGSDYIPYNTGEGIPNRIFPKGMKSAGSVADEWSGRTATKRIGVVDLGALAWNYRSSDNFFYAVVSGMKQPSTGAERLDGVISSKYPVDTFTGISVDATDKTMKRYVGNIYIRDTSYTATATFKAAMSGVYLYYELATPIEYTTDPLPDTLVPFESGGTMRRLPVDTSEEVAAPMVCDFVYGANIGDVIKSINNNTEEYRKKSDNNFTSIETGEIHCTGDIEANGNLTINDVIASAINASEEISIPTQMPSTIELGRVFMYYDEAEHQLCIRESDGTIKTIQFT